MSAVIGGDEAAVVARLDELDLTPANYNGGGQLVAAGALDALQPPLGRAAGRHAGHPAAGRRRVPHALHGARVETLRAAAADVTAIRPVASRVWSNRDGSRGRPPAPRSVDLLVDQVASPVRWDLCMAVFAEAGVSGLVELAPAGTLTGLAKRALRGVPAVAVKTPDDLEAAAALLNGASA